MELREVFEPIVNFLKNLQRKDKDSASKDYAKERLQLVLMQDRASVSPDFFEMMKKEIIEVIKKYIEIDEEALEVQLTRGFEDDNGTGPALYANIPIKNIKPVAKKVEEKEDEELVTEIINNEDLTSDINKESGNENMEDSIEQEGNGTGEISTIEKASKEEFSQENVSIEDVVEKDILNNIDESTNVSKENAEIVKDKIAEVKDGVVETFEKVKKGAKDGIKKIKTKAQKKKINE